MRLLVTGATGQVGFELARGLMPLGEVVAVDRGAAIYPIRTQYRRSSILSTPT